MKELKINFQQKFTQKDLEKYILNYWELSFSSNQIIFNLEKTEWVSSEEVTFLFSWIVKLIENNKKVNVILPFSYIKNDDNEENIKRRKFLKYYLLRKWGMFGNLGLVDLDFDNISDYNSMIDQNDKFNFGKKIIPFQRIPISKEEYDIKKVDEIYRSNSKGIFNLDDELIDFLNRNSCYSPFENRVISDIITKELVINSLEHTSEDESYFTTALNDKWENSKNKFFINHFVEEKEGCTLDFYRDKVKIQKKIEKELLNLNSKQKEKLSSTYYPSLNKYNDFANQSCLEFTYIDYGEGIYNTLKNEFIKAIENESIKKALSDNFKSTHLDSQVLEFAFLLESSKEPFADNNIRYSELIPRGLYFNIDMVRRYKGLLIARSGYGKVVYDFSNRIIIKKSNDSFRTELERIYIAKDAIIKTDNETFFPGTMISIVLPQRASNDFKKSSVRIDSRELNETVFNRDEPDYYPAEIYHPDSYEYLNLAFEYQKGEDEVSTKEFNSKAGITKLIFKSISQKLKELSNKNCVLFIDFEYIPFRNNNNILKILLYLSNNPMVNERTKVVVLNIKKEDFELLKEYEISEFSENDGFLLKPIPCVRIDKNENQNAVISDIQWIGVHNEDDLRILTDLFFGNIECNKGYPLEFLENKYYYEGNVITKHNERAYSIFTDFQDLVDKAKRAKTNQLENWLLDELVDGSDFENPEERFYFLTSKGSYQRKYLSLYETLNFKYTAQYFAHYLLDKYIDKHKEIDPINFKVNSKFNKIIVVTVSSQLLGVEIRDLIKDDDNYDYLRINPTQSQSKAKISDCPKLIKLASYFSFDSEKPFQDINEYDSVLIVNDVISTGSLLKRIADGIEEKNASVSGVISIADSRKSDDEIDPNIEYNSHFLGEVEKKMASILSYKNNQNFNLIKLKNKPDDVIHVKRINPILNAVVSLESEHTEKLKILFEDPKDLFDKDPFKADIFRIGHFKHNLSHNSYFTNMHNLFYDKNGKELLCILKDELERKLIDIDFSPNDYLTSNLVDIKNSIAEKEVKATKDLELINALEKVIDSINIKNNNFTPYKPTFIFHPVYSGIEELSEDSLHDIFGTDKVNILSLQRYETKNGWRFPFPAKRFNKPTKGAHILILDSGSLSGQSLVQLIDSISFLDVGRIDFLSVVSRIDDFQREFYSRLKSIKVKFYDENDEYHKTNKENRKKSIINLNVMFGVNLHIPSYTGNETCIYCLELKKLNRYSNDYRDKLPEQALKYIESRTTEEIPLIDNPIGNFKFPPYIPTLKENEIPDFKEIFSIRDRLGKVDSYRFYIEYFEYFDDISKHYDGRNLKSILSDKDLLKNVELILICVLHEPHLVNVLKDLLSGIYDLLIDVVNYVLNNPSVLNDFNYEWSKYAIIRTSFSLKSQNHLALKDFFHFEYFQILFSFTQGCDKSLNYLSYLLSGSFFQLDGEEFCKKNRIEPILNTLKKNYLGKDTHESRVLNTLIKKYELYSVDSIKNSVMNLYNFYNIEEASIGHTVLEQTFTDLKTAVENSQNNQIVIDFKELEKKVDYVIDRLNKDIYQNLNFLYNKKDKIKEWFGIRYESIFGQKSVYKELDTIMNLYKNVDSKNILDISSKLYIFNLKHLFRTNEQPLYEFSSQMEFNINETLISIVQNFNHKDLLSIKYKLDTSEQKVKIQKVFFESTIEEILKNVVSKTKKESVKIELLISTTLINNNQIELKFEQNSCFDSEKKEGGVNNIIKPYFNDFGVLGTFNIIEKKPKYIFKINFEI